MVVGQDFSKSIEQKLNKITPRETEKNSQEEDIQKSIQQLLESVLLENIQKQQKEQTESHNDLSVLKDVISEYLKSFFLVGYDMTGEKTVYLRYAPNLESHHALMSLTGEYLMAAMRNDGVHDEEE